MKKLLLLTSAIVISLGLVACGGDSEETTPAPTTEASAATSEAPASEAPASEAPASEAGPAVIGSTEIAFTKPEGFVKHAESESASQFIKGTPGNPDYVSFTLMTLPLGATEVSAIATAIESGEYAVYEEQIAATQPGLTNLSFSEIEVDGVKSIMMNCDVDPSIVNGTGTFKGQIAYIPAGEVLIEIVGLSSVENYEATTSDFNVIIDSIVVPK